MSFIIKAGETDPTKLAVPIFIVNTDGTEHTASLSTVKARLSVNSGTPLPSTNDVTRVEAGQCSVQLTTAEAAALVPGDQMTIKVPASGTRMMAFAFVQVPAGNVFAATPTAAQTAAAVRDEMLSVRFGLQTVPAGGSQQVLTITDTPSGTVLGVVRRQFDSTGKLVGQTEVTAS